MILLKSVRVRTFTSSAKGARPKPEQKEKYTTHGKAQFEGSALEGFRRFDRF